MTTTSVFDDLMVSYRLWTAGRPEEALSALHACHAAVIKDARYVGEWHRIQGLILQQQGYLSEAEHALQGGLASQPLPAQAGRLALALGGLLEYEQRRLEGMDAYALALHHFRKARDPESEVMTAYNLAWLQLQFGRFEAAGETLERVILTSQRGEGKLARSLIPLGRSMGALTLGQPQLAVRRAEWAVKLAERPVYEVRARQYLVSALWAAGHGQQARRELVTLCQVGMAQADPAMLASIEVLQGLLDGDAQRLEQGAAQAHVAWQARSLLARATLHWEAGNHPAALELAGAARRLEQRQEEAILQLVQPEFQAWLKVNGSTLKEVDGDWQRPVEVTVAVRGTLRVLIQGRAVQSKLSPEGAAVVAALQQGETAEPELLGDVLGGVSVVRLHQAVDRVSHLLGDPRAIVGHLSPGKRERTWQLSRDYVWRVDDSGTGTLLGGLDSEFTQRWSG